MAEEEALSSQTTPPTKIDDDRTSFRRNSTGIKVFSSSGEKVIPHYLRASTGSCHEFCKYGHKHAAEEKAKRSIPRRIAAKPIDSHVLLDTVASLGKKKSPSTVVKVKNSPNMTRSLESLNSADSDVRGEGKGMPLVKNKVEASSKPLKQKASPSNEKNSSEKRWTSVKSKLVTSKPLASLESSGGLNGNRDAKIGKRIVTSRVASTKLLTEHTVNKAGSLNRKQNGSKKAPINDVKEAEPTDKESYEVEEKTLYVIKPEAEDGCRDSDQTENCAQEVEYAVKMENGDNGLELDQTEDLVQETECIVKMENGDKALESNQSEGYTQEVEYNSASELDQHEVESLPPPSSSAHPSLPSSSPLEDEDQEESEYTTSESEDDTFSENSESENAEISETQDLNDEVRKSSSPVQAEAEDEKAWKMKFRRGTVVEIQPENNAPRRLRFRRGRFKRREVEDDIDDNGAEKVVLKHQDVQGKKDSQGLFNNVIEETASKLVEARKSKVKALVGAFETVISLQDGKPSANAPS